MGANKPAAQIMIVGLLMVVLCISLDIYVIFGEATAPAAVSNTMCILRPLGRFASILFPDGWSRLVSDYCTTFPSEPAASIIALKMKCSIVSVALVLTIAMYPLRERPQSEEKQNSPTETRHMYLIDWIISIAMFCVPPTLAWRWFIVSGHAEEYSSALSQKAYEDIFLLAAYVGGIVLWIAFCVAVLLPVLRYLFPDQAWMRVK